MLDDLKYIHQKDSQDALGVAEKQGDQIAHEFKVAFTPKAEIRNIVLSGMGGSALPGVFVPSWPRVARPFEISRGYDIPEYVDEHTLFISSSYSGNTEETLEALAKAEAKGAQIAVITSGGKLKELAGQAQYPTFLVPGGIQPRMSSFFFMLAFVELFTAAGILDQAKLSELRETGKWLGTQTAAWRAEIPASQNLAKQIAQELAGKTVIVYAGPLLSGAANKWKICMNENAKNLAWWNQLPEFNHNEFIGWSSHPVDKPFAVVDLRSDLEHPRVQKRFEVTEQLLSGRRPAPLVVQASGETPLQQLMYSVALGDFVSIYVALINGVDPTPVDLVEKLKDRLRD